MASIFFTNQERSFDMIILMNRKKKKITMLRKKHIKKEENMKKERHQDYQCNRRRDEDATDIEDPMLKTGTFFSLTQVR